MLPGLGNRPGGIGDRPGIGNRPSQLPAERRDNLQNRLSTRDNVADRMQDRHDDWHDHLGDYHDRHHDWHHGCWPGHGGAWWNHMWTDHTALMAFRTTMWGVNRMAYGFGYWGYSNPYYTESFPVAGGYTIDYSQPLAVDTPVQAAPADASAPAPGMTDFDTARQAFYQGDYNAAMASTNKALAAMPNDPIIHEFRSLVLFAQGKYKEAAAGLYSVLSVGPGWDWTTMSSLYPNVETYTKQLRALEDYLRKNPEANDARFVLAYQYLTAGGADAAATQLKRIYKATPNDNLVKQLLLMTGGPGAIGAPDVPPDLASPPTTITKAALVGKWSAASAAGAKFNLDLSDEGNFVWTYSQNGKSQSVKGVYALDGSVLAMEPETGGVMLADLTEPKGGNFHFRMLGAPPDDPGLKFAKAGKSP